MDVLGFEIDIYLVIVLVAVVFVMCIILLLSRFMTMKKPASKKGGKKKQGERTGLLPEKPHKQIDTKPAEKAIPAPQDKPLDRPPPEAAAKPEQKPAWEPTPETAAKPFDASAVKLPVLQIQQVSGVGEESLTQKPPVPSVAPSAGRTWETSELKDQAERTTGAPGMSRLWEPAATKETKEEEKEEPQKEEESDGIMDIFGDDEEENTELSQLAEGLNDVDLDTLMKLSSEVSEILPRSNLAK
jgi:hypothetical protein